MVQSTKVYLIADDDNDYDHQKRARQAKEQAGYDGPDEEDREVIREQNDREERELSTDLEPRVNWRAEDEEQEKSLEEKLGDVDIKDMRNRNPNLSKFTFDKKRGQWCEIELEVRLIFTLLITVSYQGGQDSHGKCLRESLSFVRGTRDSRYQAVCQTPAEAAN